MWNCIFNGYDVLLGNPSALVALNCSDPSRPTLSVTTNVDYTAIPNGLTLQIDNLGVYVEFDQVGQPMFSCQINTPMSPSTVGPIVPGTSKTVAQTTRSVSSCDLGGSTPGSLTAACAFCGGTARVFLGVSVKNTASTSSQGAGTEWPLGAQPKGTTFPVTCTK